MNFTKLATTFSLILTALSLCAGGASAQELRPPGPGCLKSSDCMEGLVCHASGRCMEECRESRDCTGGAACKETLIVLRTGTRAKRCEAPPPRTGQLAGLVEASPGKGSACEISVAGKKASCSASSGEFLVAGLAPGTYKLRVTVHRFIRDMTVYVNSAATMWLGAIPTSSLTQSAIMSVRLTPAPLPQPPRPKVY